MKQVTVQKDKLLETLRHNREEHHQLFEKGQQIYHDKVIEVLEKRLKEAREGNRVRTYINLPEPVDYTDEFDRAIAMIEWDEGSTVTLDSQEFRRYVLNKWEWEASFNMTTNAYVTGAITGDED